MNKNRNGRRVNVKGTPPRQGRKPDHGGDGNRDNHHNEASNNAVESSPQPPRVMSVQERKRLILLRRSSSGAGSTGMGQGRKRRRFATGSRSDGFSNSNPHSSRSGASASRSSQSQSYRWNKSGNSNLLKGSQCSASTNIISSSTFLGESQLANSGGAKSIAMENPSNEQQRGSPVRVQDENMKSTVFSSPRPNETDNKNPTPSSSLFGEIMKRSALELISRTHSMANDDSDDDHDDGNGNTNGTPTKSGHDIEAICARKKDEKEMADEPQILFCTNDSPSSRKRFRSLVPSVALGNDYPRRRTNIFKQWNKSSKTVATESVAAEATMTNATIGTTSTKQTFAQTKRRSIFNSPQKDPKPSTQSSPISGSALTNRKSALSPYGTPKNSPTKDKNTPTTAYKGPLFQRSPQSPEQKISSTNTNTDIITATRTIVKSPERKKSTRINWNPSTPDTHRRQEGSPAMKRYYNSPGGVTLLRVLDGCMSPKVLYRNGLGGDWSRSSAGSRSNGQEDKEWKECFMRLPPFVRNDKYDNRDDDFIPPAAADFSDFVRGHVGFMDWSLKRAIKIECYPANCIPGTLLNTSAAKSSFSFGATTPLAHHRIERTAMELFMNANKKLQSLESAEEEEEIVMAQWHSALMYWQHPAIHPMPPSILSQQSPQESIPKKSTFSRSSSIDANRSKAKAHTGDTLQRQSSLPTTSLRGNTGSKKNSRTFAISGKNRDDTDLFKSVSGAKAPLRQSFTRAGLGSLGGLGQSTFHSKNVSTVSAMIEQRRNEWQMCFRSLFMNWLHRIHEINTLKAMDHSTFDREEISRLYFYSLSPGCSILLRASECFDSKGNTEAGKKLEPMIVLSSSTKATRSSMRSMNIILKTANEEDEWKTEVTEDLICQWLDPKEGKEDMNNSHLWDELEALRQAQVSIGAEVSISTFQKKSRKENKHPSTLKPVILRGHDDCAAFFELYINTFGTLLPGKSDNFGGTDVPLLISRSVSAKYMSVRHLLSSVDRKSNNDDLHQLSSVDLHGPILPCAVRDIMCAVASHFSLHKKNSGQLGEEAGSKTDPENILGSHYFITYPRVHKGEEDAIGVETKHINAGPKSIGTASSMWFNGIDCSQVTSEEGGFTESTNGEATEMTVWDINRPLSIAVKSMKVAECI